MSRITLKFEIIAFLLKSLQNFEFCAKKVIKKLWGGGIKTQSIGNFWTTVGYFGELLDMFGHF